MSTENTSSPSFAADYLRLKEANNQLRELGKSWLWGALEALCGEINQQLATQPDAPLLQTGFQPWQFEIATDAGKATMVGERLGVRYRGQTLLVEVGWPQLPEHGFIPNSGLARGRVRFSQNVMLEPLNRADLLLKRQGAESAWYLLNHKQLGPLLDETHLRDFLKLVLQV